MKILPISKIQYNNKLRKTALGCVAAFGLAATTMFNTSCKKDNITANNTIPTSSNQNTDLVDFAFRDFVNLFNLDTVGQTKVLKHSYVLNAGDSLVERFDYPTKPDTLYANGIYYYNGADQFIPSEQPFQSIWTKTQYNNEDAVKVEYKYPWESAKAHEMPEPQEIYYIPGRAGDNSMKMVVHPGTGLFNANVNVEGNTANYKVENETVINPFQIKIKENY